MATFLKVGRTGDLAPGQSKLVEVRGKRIALFNVAGTYYAIDDECTHEGGPLSEGEFTGTRVTCPWHAAVFDLTTGDALEPPAPMAVTRYDVRVSGGDIEIEI